MTFQMETKYGVNVVTLSGRLDTEKAEALEKDFDGLSQSGTGKTLVVMTDVYYMSSSMIRVLLKSLKRHKADGGEFRLAETQPPILRVLNIAGLDTLFNIHDDKEEALLSLTK